jgi:hypothetical protein
VPVPGGIHPVQASPQAQEKAIETVFFFIPPNPKRRNYGSPLSFVFSKPSETILVWRVESYARRIA